MLRFADALTAHLSLPTLLAVVSGLIGVAFAKDAPGSFPVETSAGTVALGDLSLPVALVIFGTTLGRAVSALKDWRPHVIVEHRHTYAAPGLGAPGLGGAHPAAAAAHPQPAPRNNPAPVPGEDTP